MSFKKANQLFRSGNYQEAESLYKELYEKNPLDIYLTGLKLSLMKQKKESAPIETKSLSILADKKILFITAGLKGPTSGGGIATCFHSMLKTMGEKSNREIDVIYMAHPYYAHGGFDQWKSYYKTECNVNYKVIDINNKHYGSKEMKRSYEILQYLKEHEDAYDTVVFHDFMGMAYYSLLAQKQGLALGSLRIIISAHGNHTLSHFFGTKKVSSWDEKAVIFLEKESLRLADEITSPSTFYKEWLAKEFTLDLSKIRVMPNILYSGLDVPKKFDVKFKNPDLKLIVFYGRFERLKGIDLLIKALSNLNERGIMHNVLFAGNSTKIDGVDAKEYIKRGLENTNCDVAFQLNCDPASVFKYVTENNGVCVFPTLGENAPCVVVESILYKVPFIASDIPGIMEMVNKNAHKDHLFTTGSLSELEMKLTEKTPIPTDTTLSYNMEKNKEEWVNYLNEGKKINIIDPIQLKDQPKISVVIPTCDRSVLLEEAVKSIYKQNYSNYEIIIIDDASTKNISVENKQVADRYGAKYLLLDQKRYKGYACNKGVDIAEGSLICFFDDDDIADPDMLGAYVNAFNNMPNIDVFSGFANCFEHEDYIATGKITPTYSSLALGGGLEVNSHINFFGKGTFIIKANKFNEIGGYEVDMDSVPMVDYRFYLKAALFGAKISIVPRNQYLYRKNSPNSLFYRNRNKRHLQYLAKKSMLDLMKRALGEDVGSAMTSLVWDINLPKYE